MPKKKTKPSMVTPFDGNAKPVDLFDAIADDMMYHEEGKAIAEMVPSIMNAAIDLLKLVIDNRRHNSKEMSDDDIYKIYEKSFQTIISTSSDI